MYFQDIILYAEQHVGQLFHIILCHLGMCSHPQDFCPSAPLSLCTENRPLKQGKIFCIHCLLVPKNKNSASHTAIQGLYVQFVNISFKSNHSVNILCKIRLHCRAFIKLYIIPLHIHYTSLFKRRAVSALFIYLLPDQHLQEQIWEWILQWM